MTEQKLKEYFENEITADQLSFDLKNSNEQTSYNVTQVFIKQITDGEFEIKKEHLIKLFEDTISHKLSVDNLNTISFSLMASEYFFWDGGTADGEKISNVIFELDNPEIGHDITIKNVLLWKEYLLTGEYRLDENELKQKFRSKGKYKELYQKIDAILWTDWDPLGINEDAPRDEYQSYTPSIFSLKHKGADIEAISQKLFELETKNMGLSGNIEHCRLIAEKIIDLK